MSGPIVHWTQLEDTPGSLHDMVKGAKVELEEDKFSVLPKLLRLIKAGQNDLATVGTNL